MVGHIIEIVLGKHKNVRGKNVRERVFDQREVEVKLGDHTADEDQQRKRCEQQIISQRGTLMGNVVRCVPLHQLYGYADVSPLSKTRDQFAQKSRSFLCG